jgi:hypothetical protein
VEDAALVWCEGQGVQNRRHTLSRRRMEKDEVNYL